MYTFQIKRNAIHALWLQMLWCIFVPQNKFTTGASEAVATNLGGMDRMDL